MNTKKTLKLFFAFSLCLCVCACGKSKTEKALEANEELYKQYTQSITNTMENMWSTGNAEMDELANYDINDLNTPVFNIYEALYEGEDYDIEYAMMELEVAYEKRDDFYNAVHALKSEGNAKLMQYNFDKFIEIVDEVYAELKENGGTKISINIREEKLGTYYREYIFSYNALLEEFR